MEDSAAGATATSTAFAAPPSSIHYRDSPFDPMSNGLTVMTSNERALSHEDSVPLTNTGDPRTNIAPESQMSSTFNTEAQNHSGGAFEVPNLKTEELEPDGLLALAGVNNSLANVPEAQQNWNNGDTMPFPDLDPTGIQEFYDQPATASTSNVFSAVQDENNQVQAYALLKFSDGDFYVKSTSVLLGRDMAAWEQYQKEKKRARKAQEAVELYRQEPSQPSQRGDDDHVDPSSKSSHSLEGRPAKSLPSNLSETGGIMRVDADSDDEILSKKKRRRRRIANISKSSSTTSVAPANLHMSAVDIATGSPYNENNSDPPECVRIGVHPQNPEDMGKISREHLLLYFNFEEQRWDLEVKGNGVYIGGTRHYRGETVALSNDDEIIFATVMFRFRLPDHAVDRRDTSQADEESELLDSRQISEAIGDDESITQEQRQKSGFKLKLSKREKEKPAKVTMKPSEKPKQPEVTAPESPEDEKKAGKHPQKSIKQPVATETPGTMSDEAIARALTGSTDLSIPMSMPAEQQSSIPPQLPENIPVGSVFEGVKPEELPQKRKGPGRPPKNGLISKRDEGFIKRRRKEYEKRGEEPPPLDELLAIIRAENKEKERVAKLAAAGQTGMQPTSTLGADMPVGVVRSIESTEGSPGTGPSNPMVIGSTVVQGKRPSDSIAPSESARKPSPKPRRTVKSPSPQKPESAYTEEELKKPTQTYIILIDEALRNHPTGIMDLQEIYDKICKRYPYYKYRANTTGWQSSVRHNLISCERFVEAGKQGKGRLWKIDYSFAIDRDRKRRETAQDMRPPVMHNGQMPHPYPPGQYMRQGQLPGPNGSQPNYQNVQQQMQTGMQRPGGGYYSPYNGAQVGPNQPQLPPGQQPRPQAGQMQQGQQSHPQGGQQNNNPSDAGGVFNMVVNAIMDYRSHYLRKFHDTPQYAFHEELFKKCTNFVSNVYQGEEVKDDELNNDEERRVFADLKGIITRFKGNKPEQTNQSQDGANGTQQNQQSVNTATASYVQQQQHQQHQQQQHQQHQQQQQQPMTSGVTHSAPGTVATAQPGSMPVVSTGAEPPAASSSQQPFMGAGIQPLQQQQAAPPLQTAQSTYGQTLNSATANAIQNQSQWGNQNGGQPISTPAIASHQQPSQDVSHTATEPANPTFTSSEQQQISPEEFAALLTTANAEPVPPTELTQSGESQQGESTINTTTTINNELPQFQASSSVSQTISPPHSQVPEGKSAPVTNESAPVFMPIDPLQSPPVANMAAPSTDVSGDKIAADRSDTMPVPESNTYAHSTPTPATPAASVAPINPVASVNTTITTSSSTDSNKPLLESAVSPQLVTGAKRSLAEEPDGQEVEAKRARVDQASS